MIDFEGISKGLNYVLFRFKSNQRWEELEFTKALVRVLRFQIVNSIYLKALVPETVCLFIPFKFSGLALSVYKFQARYYSKKKNEECPEQ